MGKLEAAWPFLPRLLRLTFPGRGLLVPAVAVALAIDRLLGFVLGPAAAILGIDLLPAAMLRSPPLATARPGSMSGR